jgi:hypothetical protein
MSHVSTHGGSVPTPASLIGAAPIFVVFAKRTTADIGVRPSRSRGLRADQPRRNVWSARRRSWEIGKDLQAHRDDFTGETANRYFIRKYQEVV